ncbi:MAG: hypothetical protein MZV70_03120 [Desulfobacterales bacterium]|nr:hypothetical protein [Desulfobacterales bacterium]
MLQTVFFLSMALLAFPISFLADRWSRRKTVAVMAVVWSAATYVTGLGKALRCVLPPDFSRHGRGGDFPPGGRPGSLRLTRRKNVGKRWGFLTSLSLSAAP